MREDLEGEESWDVDSVHLKIHVMTQAIPDAGGITVSAMVVLAVDKSMLVDNCFVQSH
jgi:hypothetical protein